MAGRGQPTPRSLAREVPPAHRPGPANGEFGAEVLRAFKVNGKELKPGDVLPAAEALKIPVPNRAALASTGYLRMHEQPGGSSGEELAALVASIDRLRERCDRQDNVIVTLRGQVNGLKGAMAAMSKRAQAKKEAR